MALEFLLRRAPVQAEVSSYSLHLAIFPCGSFAECRKSLLSRASLWDGNEPSPIERERAICAISWCDLWGHTVDEEFFEKFRLAELYGFDPLCCFADSSIFCVPIFGALCATAAERSLAVPICGVPEDSRIRDSGRQDVVECHLFILALCSAGHGFCSWPFLPSPGSEAGFVPDHLWTTFRNPRESLRCLVAKGCRNVSL